MENPFTLGFGQKPQEYIDRTVQKNEIIRTFSMNVPSTHAFMIAGIRGSGKTVLLSDLSNYYKSDKTWAVINLAADMDMLSASIAALQALPSFKPGKLNIEINIAGISVSRQGEEIVQDNGVLLRRQIQKLKESGKKVLFLVDEIVNNKYVQEFCSSFQIMIREGMPVFLVMAGLYENISNLQNVKTLTFLYRVPKIFLEPLSITAIAERYRNVLNVSVSDSVAMSKETKGYPFAFQILGYLCFQERKKYTELLEEYDQYLALYAYEKIWSELSDMDRKVVAVIAYGTTKIKDIREKLQISPQLLNIYRNRLMQQGIVNGSHRGELMITLPRFDRFIDMYGV